MFGWCSVFAVLLSKLVSEHARRSLTSFLYILACIFHQWHSHSAWQPWWQISKNVHEWLTSMFCTLDLQFYKLMVPNMIKFCNKSHCKICFHLLHPMREIFCLLIFENLAPNISLSVGYHWRKMKKIHHSCL